MVAGILLGRVQANARAKGDFDLAFRVVNPLVGSPAGLFNNLADTTSDFMDGMTRARSLTEENRRMKSQLLSYSNYLDTVNRLNSEINSLRALNGFDPPPGRTRVAAEITAYFPNLNQVRINVGKSKEVKQGMPVVAPGGLLGRVQSVGERDSIVVLLSSPDPSNRIGAMVVRQPPNLPSLGLLRGETLNQLIMEFNDPKSQVEVGDKVVTSGFSEFIPANIPIGIVTQVENDEEYGKRSAYVRPIINLNAGREVNVWK